MAQVISGFVRRWMIFWICLCLFSLRCPRMVHSFRSARDAVREGFMAIANLLDIAYISHTPISNLVMFDPSRSAPPFALALNRSSDLGNGDFASTRGRTGLEMAVHYRVPNAT
jgi:L-lactate permease